MKKIQYNIELKGCDGETKFDLDLDKKEYELLQKICRKSKGNSSCNCEPIIKIWKGKEFNE